MTDYELGDLSPVKPISFTYEKERYVLREASEGAATAYSLCFTAGAQWKTDDAGKRVMDKLPDSFQEADAVLVAGCVFKVAADGTESPVTVATVKGWGTRAVKKLYAKAKEISGLADATVENIDQQILQLTQQKEQVLKLKEANSPKDGATTTDTSS